MKSEDPLHLPLMTANPYPDYIFTRSPSISPPSSPFINRRPLSPQTEAQLRTACARLAHNDDGYTAAPVIPKKDREPENAHRSRRTEAGSSTNGHDRSHRSQTTEQRGAKGHKESSRGATQKSRGDGGKQSHKSYIEPGQHHVQQWVQTSEHDQHDKGRRIRPKSSTHDDRKNGRQQAPSYDHPAARSLSVAGKSDDNRSSNSYSRSASTVPNSMSTGRTSATTMSRLSDYPSRDLLANERKVTVTDSSTTAGWLRQEIAKRRGRSSFSEPTDVEIAPVQTRSLSKKGRSIGAEVKSYLRSYSSSTHSLSRRASADTIGSTSTKPRNQSLHAWKSWGRQDKDSNDKEDPEPSPEAVSPRKEINLNRELPPLPSLSLWDDGLMLDDSRFGNAGNDKRESGTAPFAQAPQQPVLEDKRQSQTLRKTHRSHPDFDELMSAMQPNSDQQAHHHETISPMVQDTVHFVSPASAKAPPPLPIIPSNPPHTDYTIERAPSLPRNFSRKISTDIPSNERRAGSRPPQASTNAKQQQNSRNQPTSREKPLQSLRRVLSNLFQPGKAVKRQEQRRGRDRQPVQQQQQQPGMNVMNGGSVGHNQHHQQYDEAASAPVIRY